MQCYTKATTKAPRKSSSSKIFSLLYLCCTLKLSSELTYFPAQLPLAALFLFIFLHLQQQQLQWCKVTEFPIHNIDTTLRLYTAILILSPSSSSSPSTHTINNDTPQQLYFTVLRSMPNVQVYISKTIAFMYEPYILFSIKQNAYSPASQPDRDMISE